MSDVTQKKAPERPREARGKLKIGDDWNAITIIALSQSNPLKAIAELVENSIDAGAKTVTITRGREGGKHFLAIRDDGSGVPRDSEGRPDFRYVATHICDSVKTPAQGRGHDGAARRIWDRPVELLDRGRRAHHDVDRRRPARLPDGHAQGRSGLHGRAQARAVRRGRHRGAHRTPLDGIRTLSGEKIQWYLAAELRDRIRQTGVRINVVDRLARKQYAVEPRHTRAGCCIISHLWLISLVFVLFKIIPTF